MEKTMVGAQNFNIKKKKKKMYYVKCAQQFMYFKNGFYKVKNEKILSF